MGMLSTSIDFFGLDIDTSALRVVQLKGGKTKSLARYGSVDIDPSIIRSDAGADKQKLAEAIKQVVGQAKITTPNVAVGLPAQRTFMTVVDIERLSPKELDQSIRLQADSLIPTPLDDSKIDWSLLGDSPKEAKKVEILLGSVPNAFIEQRLDLLESIGLNVVAFEPNGLALARSLQEPGAQGTALLLNIGFDASDLVMLLDDAPRLVRSIPIGSDAIIRSAMQNLSVDEKQAEQFVYKFGVSADKLEGQVYGAIKGNIDSLLSEVEKSIKFFQTRYPQRAIDKIILTGVASILPEFPLMVANKFAVNVEIGNAWRNATYPANRQNELLAVSHKYAVAAGLAMRNE